MDRFQRKNIAAKILSVILAAVLWIYVMNEQNPPIERTLTLPLEFRNVSTSQVVVDAPDTVRVKVRGPRSLVAGLLPKDVKPYIDLRGLSEGRHTIKVNTLVPASLELVEVNPDIIALRLDVAENRKLPVTIRVTGTMATGIVVGKTVANPAQVTVEGPKGLVEAVDKIVATVDLTGKTADFSANRPVVLLNKDGKEVEGLAVNPAKIDVSVTLARLPTRKTVDVKPIIFGELPPGVVINQITTQPGKVELIGDVLILEKTDYVYTEPINIGGLSKDTTQEIKLQVKEGYLVNPATVSVQIIVRTSR